MFFLAYLFQHDVSEVLLKAALEGVLEDCVSFVGVDLNACSAVVLRYVVLMANLNIISCCVESNCMESSRISVCEMMQTAAFTLMN